MITRILYSAVVMIAVSMLLLSCDGRSIDPDYKVMSTRMLAIKITNPEFNGGDPLKAELLIGGAGFEQSSTGIVQWLVPNQAEAAAQIPDEMKKAWQQPYNMPFNIPEQYPAVMLQQPQMAAKFEANGWLDVPVYASYDDSGKEIFISTYVRLTKTKPLHFNPEIQYIHARYKLGGEMKEEQVAKGGKLSFTQSDIPDYIALTPEMSDPVALGNDELVYRWKYSYDSIYETGMEITQNKSVINEYLAVERASQSLKDVVLHLMDVKAALKKDQYQDTIVFNVYLIVRDKTKNSESQSDVRFGVDFSYFAIEITR